MLSRFAMFAADDTKQRAAAGLRLFHRIAAASLRWRCSGYVLVIRPQYASAVCSGSRFYNQEIVPAIAVVRR
jgi:hypothetical protein